MWFGTIDGLVRYDGRELRTIRHEYGSAGSLPSNFISRITEDPEGRLWLALHMTGLCVSDKYKQDFELITTNQEGDTLIKSKYLYEVISSRAGEIWVTGDEGIESIREQEGGSFTFNESLPVEIRASR